MEIYKYSIKKEHYFINGTLNDIPPHNGKKGVPKFLKWFHSKNVFWMLLKPNLYFMVQNSNHREAVTQLVKGYVIIPQKCGGV